MDEQAGCYAEFLTEHPAYLDEIRYTTLLGSDEPEMLMSPAAMQAFIVWADAKGYLQHRELVPDVLKLLQALS